MKPVFGDLRRRLKSLNLDTGYAEGVNLTSLESSYALLLESAKKCNFAKSEKKIAKSSYIVKMFAKIKGPTNDKNKHI